ncbi:MAG: rRNA maturation RNase YbeY [Terriglobales bacterium]
MPSRLRQPGRLRPRGSRWFAVVILQKRVVGLSEVALDRFVGRARRAAGLRGTVNVLVTSNVELRSLNRRFRGQDRPTDVLSFPALPGLNTGYAGDIAISAEIAAHNARALGHSTAEEIKILALHGILHLRGYDHERDQGRMARREQKLRRDLRLPVGLIERASAAKADSERQASTAALKRYATPKRVPIGNLRQHAAHKGLRSRTRRGT